MQIINTKNKIAIFGLGAIGSVITKYLLPNKNNQLFFFNRSAKTKIQIIFKNQLETYPISLSSFKKDSFDWIVVCLKTYHLAAAKKSILQLVGPKTKIAVFRNGLNLSAEFLDLVPAKNILETIIDCPTQRNRDGSYLQLRAPKIILPDLALSKIFKQLFIAGDIYFELTRTFRKTQWEKLIESAAIGALQVLNGKPCIIFKNPKILAEYTELIKEGIAVANADGVNIPIKFSEELVLKLKTYPDHKGSSMLADKLAGRPLELGAKIGVIVAIGELHNIDIFKSKMIYKRLINN